MLGLCSHKHNDLAECHACRQSCSVLFLIQPQEGQAESDIIDHLCSQELAPAWTASVVIRHAASCANTSCTKGPQYAFFVLPQWLLPSMPVNITPKLITKLATCHSDCRTPWCVNPRQSASSHALRLARSPHYRSHGSNIIASCWPAPSQQPHHILGEWSPTYIEEPGSGCASRSHAGGPSPAWDQWAQWSREMQTRVCKCILMILCDIEDLFVSDSRRCVPAACGATM